MTPRYFRLARIHAMSTTCARRPRGREAEAEGGEEQRKRQEEAQV